MSLGAWHEEKRIKDEVAFEIPVFGPHQPPHAFHVVAPGRQIGVLLLHVGDGLGLAIFALDEPGEGHLGALRGRLAGDEEAIARRDRLPENTSQCIAQWLH